MQRHHRALAEADERERRGRQIAALELGVEEAREDGGGLVDTGPAFIWVAEGEREPLPANRRLAAGLRGVRGDEGCLGQESLPRPADVDEVVAVGAVAVQEHDELARRSRARLEPRTVEFSHCPPPLGSARRRAAGASHCERARSTAAWSNGSNAWLSRVQIAFALAVESCCETTIEARPENPSGRRRSGGRPARDRTTPKRGSASTSRAMA